eukprot:UN03432
MVTKHFLTFCIIFLNLKARILSFFFRFFFSIFFFNCFSSNVI